jgi:FAD-dependent urate hydroxylase
VDILIAGGGVGGLALARGLAGSRHRVRVFEQAPRLRTGGAAFTIFSNGAAALAGLGAPLDDFGGRLDTLRFDTADGHTMVTADLTVLARRTGFPVTSVPRYALIEHLAQGVPVEFSRAIVDVEARPDGVTAIDATGDRHQADVVVGADGHRSAVRRAILDPAPATENEWTTWQGLSPVLPELANGTTGVCVVGHAGLVGLLPSGDGLLMWWFDVHQPLQGPPAAALAARFTGYGPLVERLLEKVRDEDLEPFQHVTHRIPNQCRSEHPDVEIVDAAAGRTHRHMRQTERLSGEIAAELGVLPNDHVRLPVPGGGHDVASHPQCVRPRVAL